MDWDWGARRKELFYNGDHALGLEEGVKVLKKFEGEKGDGLGTAGEDVVNDVIEETLSLAG